MFLFSYMTFLFSTPLYHNHRIYMSCRDCFKDLDPSKDIVDDKVCRSCSDKNEEFWNSIIKLLEDSYSEV